MDIGLKIRRNPNFHYIRYDPLRPTEELTHPYIEDKSYFSHTFFSGKSKTVLKKNL